MSNTHKNFNKYKHIKLTIGNPNINDIDKVFYAYIIPHIKKYGYYLINCEFNLVFIDNKNCPYVTSKLSDDKIMISWSNFFKKVISDFNDKGYKFNHTAEMNIITMAQRMDMSYDFQIKNILHSVEWKLNALINKDKNLMNKLNRNWRPILNRKIESYRV